LVTSSRRITSSFWFTGNLPVSKSVARMADGDGRAQWPRNPNRG
jgi:hypothetical protein